MARSARNARSKVSIEERPTRFLGNRPIEDISVVSRASINTGLATRTGNTWPRRIEGYVGLWSQMPRGTEFGPLWDEIRKLKGEGA